MKRVICALNMPRRVLDFVYQAEFIADCLATDPTYADSAPPLDVFEAHLATLRQATQNVYTRALGSVAAREAAALAVMSDLLALRHFVQRLADGSVHAGPAIITNAGMYVKNATGPVKGGFVVKQGRVSGTARMIALAESGKASYDWQYSLDGVTWLSLASTVYAHQDVTGLVPGKVHYFRYRALTKAGAGDWSQVVRLLVV
jgi:hypothetical protein